MPTTTSGSLIFPVLIWDKNPPECHISSILISENENYILTGTTSGHIIIWDLTINEARFLIDKSFVFIFNKIRLLQNG